MSDNATANATFDDRQTRDPATREAELFERLRLHLAATLPRTPALRDHLGDIDPNAVTDRTALSRLPILRKAALMARQQDDPPYGGFLPEGALPPRTFVSPGPIHEPQPLGADPYASARALHAAGFRPGDVVINCFGYHGTPGGFILDEGARALGCTVYPAGPGNTDATVVAMRALAARRPVHYVGTPDFLKVLLDRADGEDRPSSLIGRALVSGGALFPAMRDAYAKRGVSVLQCLATADVGVIAYETATGDGPDPGMVVSEDLIVEIVTPGTGDPVEPGEVGEIVVTPLDTIWPLVRFATGDMSRVLSDASTPRYTNMRIAGWMGRADQRTKVKGMFVDPAQVAKLRARFPDMTRARLVVMREGDTDAMVLRYQGGASASEVETAMREEFALGGQAERVDDIPADGIVIEDTRTYDT